MMERRLRLRRRLIKQVARRFEYHADKAGTLGNQLGALLTVRA